MDEDTFVEFYSDLCDAVERGVWGYDDDDFKHTSKEARAAANKILDVLSKYELL